MLLCVKRHYFYSRTCLPLCPLLSLTFCRSSLTSSHKTCHRDYHLFKGLSIKLTQFPMHHYPTVHHTIRIQRRRRRLCVKYRSCSIKVIYANLLVLVLFLLYSCLKRMVRRVCVLIVEASIILLFVIVILFLG